MIGVLVAIYCGKDIGIPIQKSELNIVIDFETEIQLKIYNFGRLFFLHFSSENSFSNNIMNDF